ncbi:11218_t:CDS:2 [Entrophospora sp. SA101]|nr:11218_t:CDS:2 [Entrophospora sp. SA101]
MEIHQDLNSSYILWLKAPKGMDPDLESEDKVWVPLLPADHTFTNLKETKHYDYMFTTLRDELEVKGKFSMPSLLGFDNADNVIYLSKKTNERATKAMKCKGNEITLLVSNNGNVLELYQARHQIKKIKNKLESTRSERDKVEEDDNNNNTNHLESKEELENTVNKIIDDNNLGSTIFMSTENYLKLLLTFPCKQCGESKVSCKRWEVKAWGLYLNVAIYCRICKYSTEFTNEPDCMSYSKTLAATGLIAGLNRRELETGLAFMGITSQSFSKSYFQYQRDYYDPIKNMAREIISSALNKVIEKSNEEGKKTIPCSFDVSWSHVRNAPQASGEFIYDGYIETSCYKPVIAFSICENLTQ